MKPIRERRSGWVRRGAVAALVLGLPACDPGHETRTFELRYLPPHEAEALISPYVFTDGSRLSTAEGAITVRERSENLDQVAQVLERFDRPRPTVMLNFQIIRANGEAAADPAIAAVERELRRLFRFDGYELVAEATVGGIAGTGIRQRVGEAERYLIEAGVTEVRPAGDAATVTLDVTLHAMEVGEVLSTTVTIPAGHSVVLGTAQTPASQGAIILVVRADVLEAGQAPPGRAGDAAG